MRDQKLNELLESRAPEAVDAFMAKFKEMNNVKDPKNANIALFELDFGEDSVTFAIRNGKGNQLPATDRLVTDGMTIKENDV